MANEILEKGIPVWYKISATLESIFLLKHKKESIQMIDEAKKKITCPRELEEWYQKNKFKYFSDKIDLSSLPWVVVARRGGDCDDFMSLSYEIMKDKFECKKVLVYSTDGRAHAIMILKEKDSNTYTVFSNYEKIKDYTSVDEAAHYYKDKTKRIIYLSS